MKKKKMWRYYCDYCKKASCSGGYMSVHEKHCTMNPKRECRMCGEPVNIAEILPLLPKPVYKSVYDQNDWELYKYIDNTKELEKSVDIIKKFTNCPACILAVMRQNNKFGQAYYDYKKERADWWTRVNEKKLKEESYY